MTELTPRFALLLVLAVLVGPPLPANATGMDTLSAYPIFLDCTVPEPGRWPADTQPSFVLQHETTISSPGESSTDYTAIVDLTDAGYMTEGGTLMLEEGEAHDSTVVGPLTPNETLCGGARVFTFDGLLPPGAYHVTLRFAEGRNHIGWLTVVEGPVARSPLPGPLSAHFPPLDVDEQDELDHERTPPPATQPGSRGCGACAVGWGATPGAAVLGFGAMAALTMLRRRRHRG